MNATRIAAIATLMSIGLAAGATEQAPAWTEDEFVIEEIVVTAEAPASYYMEEIVVTAEAPASYYMEEIVVTASPYDVRTRIAARIRELRDSRNF